MFFSKKMSFFLMIQVFAITSLSGLLFAQTANAIPVVVATINVGASQAGAAYDSAKGEVFVVTYNSYGSVISDATNTVVANVTVGTLPNAVAYDSAKGEIFVTNLGSNTVSVISAATNTVVATVTVGSRPNGQLTTLPKERSLLQTMNQTMFLSSRKYYHH